LSMMRLGYEVTGGFLSCSEDHTIDVTTLATQSHYYFREFRMLSQVPGKVVP
jgi:hypothetical protein